MTHQPIVRHISEAAEEVWADHRGSISFRTAVGDGTTPTGNLCSGLAHLEPGGWLGLHRHTAPEVYQVLTGEGIVTLEGIEHEVRAGSAVYIPSDAEHGIRNSGGTPLEFLYVYESDAITDIEYVWTESQ